MTITIISRGRLRCGASGRFLAALPGYLAAVRSADGCISAECQPCVSDACVIETVECWASPLAAMRNLMAPYARAFHAVQAECLVAPPELIVRQVPA